jgi:hypothetical protein
MTPISPVPQRVSQLPMECIGMAVVKMPVTSWQGATAPSGFEARTPKGGLPTKAATASLVPANPLHGPW